MPEILDLFAIYKLNPTKIRTIHTQIKSPAKLVLLEGEKDSRKQLEILAPLIIYQTNGEYSEEIKQWYQKT